MINWMVGETTIPIDITRIKYYCEIANEALIIRSANMLEL